MSPSPVSLVIGDIDNDPRVGQLCKRLFSLLVTKPLVAGIMLLDTRAVNNTSNYMN